MKNPVSRPRCSRVLFFPSPVEVAEVIEVPLDHLLDTAHRRVEEWVIRGVDVQVPHYVYRNYKIWGATAMVLARFLALID